MRYEKPELHFLNDPPPGKGIILAFVVGLLIWVGVAYLIWRW